MKNKRFLIITLLFLIIAFFSYSQEKYILFEKDWDLWDIWRVYFVKGKSQLKSRVVFEYYVDKDGKITNDVYSERAFSWEYDINGNVVKEEKYNFEKNKFNTIKKCEYNQNNDLIKEINYDETGVFISEKSYDYKYNKRGNIIEKNAKFKGYAGKKEEKYKYKYNWRKQLIEIITFKNNKLNGKEEFIYNKKGYEIEHLYFNFKKSKFIFDYKIVTSYDKKNNIIEYGIYDDKGKWKDYKAEYKYDNKHNIIEKITYELGEAPLNKKIYIYDGNNNRIEYKIYSVLSNELGSYAKFNYDEKGNVVEEYIFNNNNILLKYYKFNNKYFNDSSGNN